MMADSHHSMSSSSNARSNTTTSNGPNSSNVNINISTKGTDTSLLLAQSTTANERNSNHRSKTLHANVSKTLNQTAPTTAMYLDTVEMMNVYGDIAINNGQLSPVQSKKELELGFTLSSPIIVGATDGKMMNSNNIARLYCSVLRDLSRRGTEDIVTNNNNSRLIEYIAHRSAFFERHFSHIVTSIETGSINMQLLPLVSNLRDRAMLEAINIKPDAARAQILKSVFDALGYSNRYNNIWPPEAVYNDSTVVINQQQQQQLTHDNDGLYSIDASSTTSASLVSVLTPVSRKHNVASNITIESDDNQTNSSNLLKSRASVADSEAATAATSLAYMLKCLPITSSASFIKLNYSQGLRYLCEHAACGHVSITITAAEVSKYSYILQYIVNDLYCMSSTYYSLNNPCTV
jgi:hypothetical protein